MSSSCDGERANKRDDSMAMFTRYHHTGMYVLIVCCVLHIAHHCDKYRNSSV